MRVADRYLESVFYLYPDITSAEAGSAIGGTGFFVSQEPGDGLGSRLYAVTDRHLIEGGNVVLRLNSKAGNVTSLDTEERLWTFHSDGDDLAILPIEFGWEGGEHVVNYISRDLFLDEEDIATHGFGSGDETFSIGRVVNQEGRKRNTPTVRFGNIAQMPGEPVIVDRGGISHEQISFLVESRSIGGYSGSPVFTFIPPSSVRGTEDGVLMTSPFSQMVGPVLLGVNWAHMNDFVTAKDMVGNELPYKIQSNSGMMAVIPAWKLAEMLDMPEFKQGRDKAAQA